MRLLLPPILLVLAAAVPVMGEEAGSWALRPLVRPVVPEGTGSAIDRFVDEALEARGLERSGPASGRALVRRATFDLTGLPPTPEAVAAFEADEGADAYGRLIDRLLASPRYGERWTRHWMDVAHFAETQGHDEDAIRPNAWPYRDYLVESFNADKPYARFVMEQVAGDVLYPGEPGATVATGFLAAGPWDGSSQMGIQDGTRDKKVAQYLDRDDMLTTVMLSFNSLTVHCARCHDHKFDPIPTADYYALQAVFAGVDRVDRPYDADPETGRERARLAAELAALDAEGGLPEARLREVEGDPAYRKWIAESAEGGAVWQVLDPDAVEASGGATVAELDDHSLLYGGARPEKDTYIIRAPVTGMESVTAVRLEVLADPSLPQQGPGRQDNGNLHLSEFRVEGTDGKPVRIARAEADWNQDGWGIERAIDGVPETAWGIFPNVGASHTAVFHFAEPIKPAIGGVLTFTLEQAHGGGHLIGRPRLSASSATDPSLANPLPDAVLAILAVPAGDWSEEQRRAMAGHYLRRAHQRRLEALPAPSKVFSVASDFEALGNYKPAAVPRPVHVLGRGNIDDPGEVAQPGALSCVSGLEARFELPENAGEGERRAALARWLAHRDNVLTWRSIVNRVWHYHFGRGLAATPNDFGEMGEAPTHPELLDWLAYEFRERGGSLKWLHREIVTSETYRQASTPRGEGDRIDKDNRWLWRMHRPRLDAESLRDAVLAISGKLDLTMGGPSARQFLESKGVHVTPNLDYLGFDPDDPANYRRSIYRFVFRTVPDPLMQALDCPDASQWTPERSASFNALGALAMANSPFLVRQCEHLAARLEAECATLAEQIVRLYQLAFQRDPDAEERAQVSAYAERHGLANACRIILNSNEFVFLE